MNMATEKRLIDMEDALRRMENAEHLMHSINGIKAVDIGALRQFFGMLKPVDAWEIKAKVGDLVYALWEAPVKLKYIIYCAEVKEIRISMRNCRLTTTYRLEPIMYRGQIREYREEDFGTLVFTDQKDAERKLYPCENCVTGTHSSCEGCSYGERKDNGN